MRDFTFQEFFARILLEKGLMSHRSRQIIYHELEDWLNILRPITRVVLKGSILRPR